jgi:hypothetical protein
LEDPIFTTTWDATFEANNLEKGEDGIYTLELNDVPLTPGKSILYKVVADNSWDYLSWGFDGKNADYTVKLPEGETLPEDMTVGYFDITFKFSPDQLVDPTGTYNLTCEAVYDKAKTVYVATNINSIIAGTVNNNQVYNLNGQRVMKAQKGLYIINGKKVVVK